MNIPSINLSSKTPNEPPQKTPPSNEKEEAIRKKICANCETENPNAKICGRCRLIYYCNSTCQKAHWSFHKTICKKPEQGKFFCNVWNQGEREITTKEMSVKIHSEKDTHQPHARPTGIGALKSGAFEGLSGNSFSYINKEDVVVFCEKYHLKTNITKLKNEGYNGFKKIEEEKLESLLKKQDYIEILKYVWTEEDVEFKLKWLKTQAAQGHVILMFETSRAICELTNPSKEIILEAFRWRTLGRIHTILDAACHGDNSVIAALGFLTNYYPLEHLVFKYEKEIQEELMEKIQAQNKIIYEIQLKETDPSPKWVMYHGISCLMGQNTLAPEEQWLQLRTKKHQELVREFKN